MMIVVDDGDGCKFMIKAEKWREHSPFANQIDYNHSVCVFVLTFTFAYTCQLNRFGRRKRKNKDI